MKKKISIVLGVILLLFLAVTVYFYVQHQYSVEIIRIDTYLELEDFDLYITDVKRYDVEKTFKTYDNTMMRWVFESRMPTAMKMLTLKFVNFYRNPYERYENEGNQCRYVMNAVKIPHGPNYDEDANRGKELRVKMYEVDSGNFRGTTGGGWSKMDDSNYYLAHYTIYWPFDTPDKIAITDLKTDEETTILIGQTKIEKYSYFHREQSDRDDMSSQAMALVMNYSNEDMKACMEIIHEDYGDDFDWTYLDGVLIPDFEVANLKYIGEFQGFDHAFTIEITDHNRALAFYTIYEDGQWTILGVAD